MPESESSKSPASRSQRWSRDVWNVWLCKIPSRRIRKFFIRRLLGTPSSTAFVGIGVQLYDPWSVHLGNRVVLNGRCVIDARGGDIRIGDDTDIGMDTALWTLQHDPHSPTHGTVGGPITLMDHVWIATRVTILPNVTIGRGAVVATGAVVTKDVEPMTIVAGVPAKPIGKRNNPLTYQLHYNPRFR